MTAQEQAVAAVLDRLDEHERRLLLFLLERDERAAYAAALRAMARRFSHTNQEK